MTGTATFFGEPCAQQNPKRESFTTDGIQTRQARGMARRFYPSKSDPQSQCDNISYGKWSGF